MIQPEVKFVPSPKKEVRVAQSIMQLREAGFRDYDEIADILSLGSAKEVEDALIKGLSAQERDDPKSMARSRELLDRRLERLLRAVWTKALDPSHPEQMAAQARALALIDRHAKLIGADAATKVDVEITPTQRDMADFIAAVSRIGSHLPEEGDIFGDAEVVEVHELEEGA